MINSRFSHICSITYLTKFFLSKINPYKVLGVNSTSKPEEIKLAYYKLAQQFHPDKNPSPNAAKQFASINEAYEILSNPEHRKMYDNCGENKPEDEDYEQEFSKTAGGKKKQDKKRPNFSKARTTDDYQSIFDEFDQYYAQKHGKTKQYYTKKKGEDINFELNLTFKESIFGGNKQIIIEKIVVCDECNGRRAAKGYDPQKCYTCGGSGQINYWDQNIKINSKCSNCDGYGEVIKSKCAKCDGKGVVTKKVTEDINIPKASSNGQILRKQECGNAVRQKLAILLLFSKSSTKGLNGDLLIKLNIEEDHSFKKEGNNIVSYLNLSISEAVLGTKKIINTIWGPIEIQIPAAAQPQSRISLPSKGIHYGNANWKKGDHIVVLQVDIPKELDEQRMKIFTEIFRQS